jgi:hypothetical protein
MTIQATIHSDGEPDLEWEPPPCPERCGGDAHQTRTATIREGEVWRCSDCDGAWDGCGDELDIEEGPKRR